MEKVRVTSGRCRKRNFGALVAGAAMMAVLFAGTVRADGPKDEIKLDKSLSNLKIGLLGYIDYSAGNSPQPGDMSTPYNTFAATRGYLTVETSVLPWLGARMTVDISQDKADTITVNDTTWDPGSASNVENPEKYSVPSDIEGSWVVRVKYLYAVILPQDFGPFTHNKIELGLGHMPWLDFEEHINPFRCQGTMAIERAHVFNSADLGVSMMGYLGEPLDDAKGKTGNSHYAGRYGSWHLGVYNGGGYHAAEKNQNKVFEGRVTLRPLPDAAPGLQLSYLYITGDGNKSYAWRKDTIWPYYRVQIGMLSFEHPNVIFTAQYMATDGNAGGSWVYGKKSTALPTMGYSGFLDIRFPAGDGTFNIFGRYDFFDMDPGDHVVRNGKSAYVTWIGGVAYEIYKGNMIVLAYESTDYEDDANVIGKLPVMNNKLGRQDKFQVVYQLKL